MYVAAIKVRLYRSRDGRNGRGTYRVTRIIPNVKGRPREVVVRASTRLGRSGRGVRHGTGCGEFVRQHRFISILIVVFIEVYRTQLECLSVLGASGPTS